MSHNQATCPAPLRPDRQGFHFAAVSPGIIDEDGEPTVGWEVDTRGEWGEKWPACPDGHPLKLRHALGFRERSVRELELRVSLGDDGWGVCQIIVDEREDEVYVRVLLHRSDDRRGVSLTEREYLDSPRPRVIGAASGGASRYRHGQRPRATRSARRGI